MPLLEANSVTVRFPGHDERGRACSWAAVDGISLQLKEGERIGLVGESGSGKTTLSKALLDLVPIASGQIRFDGYDLAVMKGNAREAFRRGAQMIFQDPMGSLNPRLTVGEAIEEVLAVHKLAPRVERADRVRTLFAQVGLDPDYAGRYPHEFSGGQRQRIGIARALALNPRLLVADEPVSALDVSVQAQILNLIRDLSEQRHMAVILVAHDLAVVDYVCQRVLILYKGRVVEEGATATVFGEPAHPYTQLLKSTVPDTDDLDKPRAGAKDPSAVSVSSAGCAFAPRCPQVHDACWVSIPVLKALDEGHQVACHAVGTAES